MALTRERKHEIQEAYRTHDTDTGSTALQVAILTEDIRELTEHLKLHKKDFHSRRGLMRKVGRRNRLLRYLKRTKRAAHAELVERLGLRG